MTPINKTLTIYRGLTFTFFFVLRDVQTLIAAFTVNTSTNVITTGSAHGLVVGDPVQFTTVDNGVLPTPLSSGRDYFVIAAPSATTLKISEEYGGLQLDITTAGTGTNNCYTNPPIDLTGWSFWSQIRAVAGGALTVDLVPQIDVDPTTGKVDLSKTDEQTAPYPVGNFAWDIIAENAGGERLEAPIFAGSARLLQAVSQAS